jgi:hypothetical protein
MVSPATTTPATSAAAIAKGSQFHSRGPEEPLKLLPLTILGSMKIPRLSIADSTPLPNLDPGHRKTQ